MPFLAVGVEHRTAPIDVREGLALDPGDVARISADLHRTGSEVAILATCNRTEIYLWAEEAEPAADQAVRLLDPAGQYAAAMQRWDERDAIEHLFRVASGLESRVLGEQQILGQVREALETAESAGTIGPNLHALFRAAISCARQARAGASLGKVHVSVAAEAVRRAGEMLGALPGRSALVIGGGEVAREAAAEVRRRGMTLYIANRTVSVAVDLAARLGGRPVPLRDVSRVLPHVDLVIAATSAPHQILSADDLPARDLLLIDLAVPRDIEPAAAGRTGVTLLDLDDILPDAGDWEADIRMMEAVIAAETQGFLAWAMTRRVAPIIANLREHVEAVSEAELRRVAPQLAGLTDRERAAVESLTHRLIDKMFHHLVVRLRLAAQTDPSLVDAAEFFFLHGEGGLFEHAAQRQQEREPSDA
ncbi:MAG TPA: glutamyl-tRNA reductase [Chloroflexota bacterium]|nr:glutamyl-tRNA reductase [Chloroflexota bacterium]